MHLCDGCHGLACRIVHYTSQGQCANCGKEREVVFCELPTTASWTITPDDTDQGRIVRPHAGKLARDLSSTRHY